MKNKDVIRLGENEAYIFLELNWFDLSKEAQNKIMERAASIMGTDNTFEFPNMEVRLLVRTNTKNKN